MTKIPTFNDLLRSTKIINQTRKDLLRKGYFPKYAESYLTDPNMLKAAIYNYTMEPMKSYRCPRCAITIKCPREWIHQHIKMHDINKEKRENEPRENSINPYSY